MIILLYTSEITVTDSLLHLTYEQNSRFFVNILDANGSEIDYLSKPSVCARANCRQQKEEPHDDVSVETLESEDEFSETEEKYVETMESEDDVSIEILEPRPVQRRQGKRAARERESQARNYSKKRDVNEDHAGRRGRTRQGKAKITYLSSSEGRTRQSDVNQSGESSGAKNKSFTCIIREAYVTGSVLLNLRSTTSPPRHTGRSQTWKLLIQWEKAGRSDTHLRSCAQWSGPGWKGLVRKNKLNIGDVCELEQVQKKVFHLRIIYRKTN